MKIQFSNLVNASLMLYLEERMTTRAHAYQENIANTYSRLEKSNEKRGYDIYQGKYLQLVADTTVTGKDTGVYINGAFCADGDSGVHIGYSDGTVIVPESLGLSSPTITNTVAKKTVNMYEYIDSPESIYLDYEFKTYGSTAPFLSTNAQMLQNNIYLMPCFFIALDRDGNTPFAIGGEDKSTYNFSILIVCERANQIRDISSFLTDLNETCFRVFPFSELPYRDGNTILSPNYSYANLSNEVAKANIVSADYMKLPDSSTNKKFGKSYPIGIVDMSVEVIRFPRQYGE